MQKRIISLFILIFIVFFLSVFFISLNKNSLYDTKDLVGQQIANIKLNNFYDDKFVTDMDLRKNKFILINFWASWCAPCQKEHPMLMKLKNEKNLNLLGVNFKDKNDNALKFLKKLGNPYDIMTKDELGKDSITFGIYGIPESILLDEELIVIKKFIGPISKNDYDYIKKMIK